MKARILWLFAALLWAAPVWAQTYPKCPLGNSVSCTLSITVTAASSPLFQQYAARQYLLVENQAYLGTAVAAFPVCCAIGHQNQAVWDANHNCNGFVIQAAENWEPWLFTTPQSSFRVPSGDVACISPFGNVAVTGEQE